MTTRVQIFIAPVCSTDANLGGKIIHNFKLKTCFIVCVARRRYEKTLAHIQPHNTNKHGDRKCKQETTQERRRPCGSLG